jgi:hypothetical protein
MSFRRMIEGRLIEEHSNSNEAETWKCDKHFRLALSDECVK